jgi:hypothetical protein
MASRTDVLIGAVAGAASGLGLLVVSDGRSRGARGVAVVVGAGGVLGMLVDAEPARGLGQIAAARPGERVLDVARGLTVAGGVLALLGGVMPRATRIGGGALLAGAACAGYALSARAAAMRQSPAGGTRAADAPSVSGPEPRHGAADKGDLVLAIADEDLSRPDVVVSLPNPEVVAGEERAHRDHALQLAVDATLVEVVDHDASTIRDALEQQIRSRGLDLPPDTWMQAVSQKLAAGNRYIVSPLTARNGLPHPEQRER